MFLSQHLARICFKKMQELEEIEYITVDNSIYVK